MTARTVRKSTHGKSYLQRSVAPLHCVSAVLQGSIIEKVPFKYITLKRSIVSAQYPGSQSEDAEKAEQRKPTSESWGPWYVPPRDGQDNRSAAQFKRPGELKEPSSPPLEDAGVDP